MSRAGCRDAHCRLSQRAFHLRGDLRGDLHPLRRKYLLRLHHLRRRYFLHFLRCRRFFSSNFLFLRFRFILLQQLLRLRRRPLFSFFFFLISFQHLRVPFLSFPALISTLVPKYPFILILQRDHINGEHTMEESIS